MPPGIFPFFNRLEFEPIDGRINTFMFEYGWDRIWVPDLFFRNEKRAAYHIITVPNRLLKLYDNGKLWYVIKMSVTLSCPMQFQRFPFDKQKCIITFESFTHTMDTIVLKFLPQAIEFNNQLTISGYSVVNTTTYDCSTNYTTGAYPCLEIGIIFERHFGFYLKAVFMPSTTLVLLSFLAFWITPESIVPRIATGFFTVLSMAFPCYVAYTRLPQIDYVTPIEIWLAGCMLFIFGGIIESVVVNFRNRGTVFNSGSGYPATNDVKTDLSYAHNPSRKPGNAVKLFDIISRFAFPLGFALFNVAYWVLYTT